MTELTATVDVQQRYREARKKDNEASQPVIALHVGLDFPPLDKTGCFSLENLEGFALFQTLQLKFLQESDGMADAKVTPHMVANAFVRFDELKVCATDLNSFTAPGQV